MLRCNGVYTLNVANPIGSQGVKKLLELNLCCHGHDSERRTDNVEITSDALPRNFITAKNQRINVVVTDDSEGKVVGADSEGPVMSHILSILQVVEYWRRMLNFAPRLAHRTY